MTTYRNHMDTHLSKPNKLQINRIGYQETCWARYHLKKKPLAIHKRGTKIKCTP